MLLFQVWAHQYDSSLGNQVQPSLCTETAAQKQVDKDIPFLHFHILYTSLGERSYQALYQLESNWPQLESGNYQEFFFYQINDDELGTACYLCPKHIYSVFALIGFEGPY